MDQLIFITSYSIKIALRGIKTCGNQVSTLQSLQSFCGTEAYTWAKAKREDKIGIKCVRMMAHFSEGSKQRVLVLGWCDLIRESSTT